jgi:hypothetical protein
MSRRYRAWIDEYPVVDGDVEEPVIGGTVTIGFSGQLPHDGAKSTLRGTVVWSRFDRMGDGISESIALVDGLHFLCQVPAAGRLLHEIGDPIELCEPLWFIGDYYYEAFEIPDIRYTWRVHAVEYEGHGWWVTVEPLVDGDVVYPRLNV